MKTLRNIWKIAAIALLLAFSGQVFAQDDEGPDRRPVRDVFNSTLLIDQHTNTGPYKGGLELIIHHRFGTMQNGLKDLVGIYAPSNIRMGFNYGITERLSVGIGTEKNNKIQDVYGKYLILQQKRTGMPVSLSYLFQFGVDARNEEVFGNGYEFTNRLSYFNQLILSRKFGNKVSIQVAPSFMHFNAVDSTQWNDYIGISLGARVKLFNEFSVIAGYDQAFAIMPNLRPASREARKEVLIEPKPNLGLGIEIGTPTHCFQVFAAHYDKIIPQKSMVYNQNTLGEGEVLIGFNLTVRF